jgi:hypothetical protein
VSAKCQNPTIPPSPEAEDTEWHQKEAGQLRRVVRGEQLATVPSPKPRYGAAHVKPFRLKSITVELIILFVAVLTFSEMISVGYRHFDRTDALTADRIVVIVSLIEKTPPQDRPELTRHFQGSDLPVTWTAEPWLRASESNNKETPLLRDLLRRVIPRSVATDIAISYLPSKGILPAEAEAEAELVMRWRKAGPFPEPIEHIIDKLATEPTLLVSVRLSDGSWLNLLAAYVDDTNSGRSGQLSSSP